MANKPITFNRPMVLGILREIECPGTGKTQTRRAIKPINSDLIVHEFAPRYAVEDRLYVREHWRTSGSLDSIAPRDLPRNASLMFDADPPPFPLWRGRFRQGMHMPRWASRITLTVTDVRVQRLQEISEEDALAEGIQHDASLSPDVHRFWLDTNPSTKGADWITGFDAREVYSCFWHHINGPGAWEANPWVAAYTFTVALGNIDQIARAA